MAQTSNVQANGGAEAICVGVRLRPFVGHEEGQRQILKIEGRTVRVNADIVSDVAYMKGYVVESNAQQTFTFDHAMDSFSQSSPSYVNQAKCYDLMARGMVDKIFQGFNTCLFCYGQTGTGKTMTIMGNMEVDEEQGLLIRLLRDVFQRSQEQESQGCSVSLSVQIVEIYNEKVKDLLREPNMPETKLDVHVHPKFGVYIKGAKEEAAPTVERCVELIEQGNRMKSVAATAMNAKSSRAHTVFKMKMEMTSGHDGSTATSEVFFADLAGRENEKTTKVTGERMIELTFINKSLMWLAQCIKNLGAEASTNRKSMASAPRTPRREGPEMSKFRNSKLTLILSNALSGNSKTAMIGTLSPAAAHYDESLSTLSFAATVKNIKLEARAKTGVDNAALVANLQEEIRVLKEQLAAPVTSPRIEESEEVQRQLECAQESLCADLQTKWKEEHDEAMKLQQRLKDEHAQALDLKSKLEQERAGATLLQKSLGEENAQASELRKKLENATAEGMLLQKKLADESAHALDLKRKLENEQALDLKSKLEHERAGTMLLQKSLGEENAQALELRKKLENANAEAMLLQKKLADESAHALDLKRKLENEQAEATQLQKKMADEQADALTLQKKLEHEHLENQNLRKQLTGEQTAFLEAQAKSAQLQTTIANEQAEALTLQKKLEQEHLENQNLRKQLTGEHTAFLEAEAKSAQLQTTIANEQAEALALQKQLEQEHLENQNLRKQLTGEQTAFLEAQAKAAQLQTNIENEQAEALTLQDKLEQEHLENQDLRKKLTGEQTAFLEAQAEAAHLQTKIANEQAEALALQEKIKQEHLENQDLHEKLNGEQTAFLEVQRKFDDTKKSLIVSRFSLAVQNVKLGRALAPSLESVPASTEADEMACDDICEADGEMAESSFQELSEKVFGSEDDDRCNDVHELRRRIRIAKHLCKEYKRRWEREHKDNLELRENLARGGPLVANMANIKPMATELLLEAECTGPNIYGAPNALRLNSLFAPSHPSPRRNWPGDDDLDNVSCASEQWSSVSQPSLTASPFKGHLWKKSPSALRVGSKWDRRYVTLMCGRLSWYAEASLLATGPRSTRATIANRVTGVFRGSLAAASAGTAEQAHGGYVDLPNNRCTVEAILGSETQFGLHVQGGSGHFTGGEARTFFFDCEGSEHDRAEWMASIKAHIKCSTTHGLNSWGTEILRTGALKLLSGKWLFQQPASAPVIGPQSMPSTAFLDPVQAARLYEDCGCLVVLT